MNQILNALNNLLTVLNKSIIKSMNKIYPTLKSSLMEEAERKQPLKVLHSIDREKVPLTVKKKVKYIDQERHSRNEDTQNNHQRDHKDNQSDSHNPIIIQKDKNQYRQPSIIYRLKQRIAQQKNIKKWHMSNGKYRAASAADSRIKQTLNELKKQMIRKVSLDHLRQKMQVKAAHRREMNNFYRVWQNIRQFSEEYKRSTFSEFERQRDIRIQKLKVNLRMKYFQQKHKNKALIQLEKHQKILIKANRYDQLILLKKDKAKTKKQYKKEKKQLMTILVKRQQQKFQANETKRYNSLLMRVEETQKDSRRKFNREQARLKQKYKNVMNQLNHQQTQEINMILWKEFV